MLLFAGLAGCAAPASGSSESGSAAEHVLVAHSIPKAGKRDALLAHSGRLAAGMLLAPGFLRCRVYASDLDDEPVMIISTWLSQESQTEFMSSAAGKALLASDAGGGVDSLVDQSWQVSAMLAADWRQDRRREPESGAYAYSLHAIANRGSRMGLLDAAMSWAELSRSAAGLLAYSLFASRDEDGPVTAVWIWSSLQAQEAFAQSELGRKMLSPGVSPEMDSMIDRAWTVESELVSAWQTLSN